jgi:putative tryptophan/tyrosine transport system substrate-binding protein
MKRRHLLTLVAGAAVLFPFAVGAQPDRPSRVIGFLSGVSPGTYTAFIAAVRRGLEETGYVEGKNLKIEYRWADEHRDRLPALAEDLVRGKVEVILASGGAPRAARDATSSIPIVFVTAVDPVASGIVNSMNRPGGNVTGISFLTSELIPKRLELLRELVPDAAAVALLVNPNTPGGGNYTKSAEEAAQRLGLRLRVIEARREADFERIFRELDEARPGALLVGTDPLFTDKRDQLVSLAAAHGLPASYAWRDFAEVGGLMSYGTSLVGVYHRAGIYAGRILNGEKPADLPVEQPTKFELVINLKTAKTLGLAVPQSLLARADEVIE